MYRVSGRPREHARARGARGETVFLFPRYREVSPRAARDASPPSHDFILKVKPRGRRKDKVQAKYMCPAAWCNTRLFLRDSDSSGAPPRGGNAAAARGEGPLRRDATFVRSFAQGARLEPARPPPPPAPGAKVLASRTSRRARAAWRRAAAPPRVPPRPAPPQTRCRRLRGGGADRTSSSSSLSPSPSPVSTRPPRTLPPAHPGPRAGRRARRGRVEHSRRAAHCALVARCAAGTSPLAGVAALAGLATPPARRRAANFGRTALNAPVGPHRPPRERPRAPNSRPIPKPTPRAKRPSRASTSRHRASTAARTRSTARHVSSVTSLPHGPRAPRSTVVHEVGGGLRRRRGAPGSVEHVPCVPPEPLREQPVTRSNRAAACPPRRAPARRPPPRGYSATRGSVQTRTDRRFRFRSLLPLPDRSDLRPSVVCPEPRVRLARRAPAASAAAFTRARPRAWGRRPRQQHHHAGQRSAARRQVQGRRAARRPAPARLQRVRRPRRRRARRVRLVAVRARVRAAREERLHHVGVAVGGACAAACARARPRTRRRRAPVQQLATTAARSLGGDVHGRDAAHGDRVRPRAKPPQEGASPPSPTAPRCARRCTAVAGVDVRPCSTSISRMASCSSTPPRHVAHRWFAA